MVSFLGLASTLAGAVGLIVSRGNGAVLGFFLVELFGEVQDERNKGVDVRVLAQAWCRGDAATSVGGAGEGHGGEVHTPAPESPHPHPS